MLSLLALAGAVWLALPAGAHAQRPVGGLTGRVQDAQGASLVGATVTVSGRGITRTAKTDADGRFFVSDLDPGDYILRVEAEGFKTGEWSGVRVQLGKSTKLDLTLELAPTPPEEVVITVRDAFSGRPIPGTTVTTVGSYVNDCWRVRADDWTVNLGIRYPKAFVTGGKGEARLETCDDPEDPGRLRFQAGDYDARTYGNLLGEAGWRRGTDGLFVPVELIPRQSPFELGGKGLSLGVGGELGRIDTYEATRITDDQTILLNGVEVERSSDSQSSAEYEGLFGNNSEEQGAGLGVDWQPLEIILNRTPTRHSLAGSAPGGRSGNQPPGARAITTLRAFVGRSDVEFRYDKLDDTTPGGRDTLWSGSGRVFRVGVSELVLAGRGRGLYLNLAYDYERLLETDLTRSPGLQATGGRLLHDEGRYRRQTHLARAVLGWSSRYAAPWAGVRLYRSTVRLAGEAAAAFDIPQGVVEQQVSFVNEFKANRVLADLGLEVRIPKTRVYVRAEGATNGSDTHLGVSVSHGWSFGR